MAGHANWLDAGWNNTHLNLGGLPTFPLSTNSPMSPTVYVT